MREETAIVDRLARASSALTDRFPRGGARLLDAMVGLAAGNPVVLARGLASARAAVARVDRFRRILVVADLNIGDAVMLQAAVAALRDFLPNAEIDYAVSRLTGCLIGDRGPTAVHPILGATAEPGLRDAFAVRRLTDARRYDLVFNFCPFFDERSLVPAGTPVVGWVALGAMMVRGVRKPRAAAHVTVHAHRLIHTLLAPVLLPQRAHTFKGVSVALSQEAAERAADFVGQAAREGLPLVLLNPDASSRFTRPPLELELALLRGLLRLPCTPVVGAGHTAPGLEQRLLEALTPAERRRVRILPASMPLDGYAAVVDAAAVFVSGDTGPLHVAAALKRPREGGRDFRNRTAVVSLFGPTPARLYGYASGHRGFLPANQAAPSFAHEGASPCRNLTCIHKTAKTCAAVRCFEQLEPDVVLADVARVLRERQVEAVPAAIRTAVTAVPRRAAGAP